MRHLHQELLAELALGEKTELSRHDRLHLRVCRHCTRELTELRAIVAVGREGRPDVLRSPRPGVLDEILAEVADDAPRIGAPVKVAAGAAAATDRPSGGVTRGRTRRPLTAAIAAVALLAVSAGGVIWYRQAVGSAAVTVARATLQPLPDKTGDGTAELVHQDGADVLVVEANVGGGGTGFHELWLINTDGRRMISLGALRPDGRGSYLVPEAPGEGLDGYTIVDISLEPFDGDVAHSRNSLLRGNLA